MRKGNRSGKTRKYRIHIKTSTSTIKTCAFQRCIASLPGNVNRETPVATRTRHTQSRRGCPGLLSGEKTVKRTVSETVRGLIKVVKGTVE